jgi:hypothetical protein
MVGGMIDKNEREDFSVVVKQRPAAEAMEVGNLSCGKIECGRTVRDVFSNGDGRPQGGKGGVVPTVQKT